MYVDKLYGEHVDKLYGELYLNKAFLKKSEF